jgi:hypothetical protein
MSAEGGIIARRAGLCSTLFQSTTSQQWRAALERGVWRLPELGTNIEHLPSSHNQRDHYANLGDKGGTASTFSIANLSPFALSA